MKALIIGLAFVILLNGCIDIVGDDYKTAIEQEDPSLCDELPAQHLGKDMCYWNAAHAKRDPAICDRIQDQRNQDYCNWAVARVKGEPAICDKIQGQERRDDCYDVIECDKQTPSLCDENRTR